MSTSDVKTWRPLGVLTTHCLFLGRSWGTRTPISNMKAWWPLGERDHPLALFRVQLGHSDTHKWCEGLKTTWGHDLPLALFKVQLGNLHAHKWHEGLKNTWGRDLPLVRFRVHLGGSHAHKWLKRQAVTWRRRFRRPTLRTWLMLTPLA